MFIHPCLVCVEPASTKAPSLAGMLGLRGKDVLDAPPPVTETENRLSEFAPPPPTEAHPTANLTDAMDKFFDDSNLGSSITPLLLCPYYHPLSPRRLYDVAGKKLTLGRLSMKCMQGFEIRKKDEKDPNARMDPFIKFRLGAALAPIVCVCV